MSSSTGQLRCTVEFAGQRDRTTTGGTNGVEMITRPVKTTTSSRGCS